MKNEPLSLSSLALLLFEKEGRRKYSEEPERWLEGLRPPIKTV